MFPSLGQEIGFIKTSSPRILSRILEICAFKETASLENDSTHPSPGMITYQVNPTRSVQKLKNTHDI